MKKNKTIKAIFITLLIVLIIVPITYYSYNRVLKYEKFHKIKNIRVLLVYGTSMTPDDKSILSVYASVLQEKGVAFKIISCSDLISFDPLSSSKNVPAVIFPDMSDQELPSSIEFWAKNYLRNGGNIAVIYNAGTKNKEGLYKKRGVFSSIIGLNYILYNKITKRSYVSANLMFASKNSANFFQIPEGSMIDKFLSGYQYGPLNFSMAYTATLNPNAQTIYAYGVTKNGKKFPAIVLKSYGKGQILYVDLQLGHLKGYASNGLLIKAFIGTFLYKIVKIPHLLYTPYGKGGLVVNWHIENYLAGKSILYMIKNRILRKNLKFSFDISAGDFEDHPGDGRGVGACGKNRIYIKMLLPYGIIGTDGGWTHNYWFRNVLNGKFNEKKMYELIKKNNQCLQSITGYKILEYMPAEGVFPQPVSTEILAKLGMIATYYTGSINSGPTRMFWNGKMISRKVIAFPVLIDGDIASLYELREAGKSDAEVFSWQKKVVDYCIRNRVVRLWYSHPYDIWMYHYTKAMKLFVDYMEKKQKQGKLIVEPMAYFAKFILRFLKTKFSFVSLKNGSIRLFIKNKDGLKGITVALPKNRIIKPDINSKYTVDEGKNYYYISFYGDLHEDTIDFKGIDNTDNP